MFCDEHNILVFVVLVIFISKNSLFIKCIHTKRTSKEKFMHFQRFGMDKSYFEVCHNFTYFINKKYPPLLIFIYVLTMLYLGLRWPRR